MSYKRTHADPKQFHRALTAPHQVEALADGHTLFQLEMGKERTLLRQVANRWIEDPQVRGDLGENDLLSVALANELPFAFEFWLECGLEVDADTLLALFQCNSKCFALDPSTDHLEKFFVPHMAPWHGALFSSLIIHHGLDEKLAINMLDKGLVEIQTPLPSSGADAEGWLWWQEPARRNFDDATLPIILALRCRRWNLAEKLYSLDASLTDAAPNGEDAATALAALEDLDRRLPSSLTRGEPHLNHWQARIKSAKEALDLETSTQETTGQQSTRRL